MKKLLLILLVLPVMVFKMEAQSPDSLLKSMPENATAQDRVEFLTVLINADSSAGIYFRKRGESYYALQLYDKAMHDLEKAVSLGYIDNDLFTLMGFTVSAQNDYGKAIMYFTKAIQNAPDNENLYAYRGYAYMILNDSKMAEADYAVYLKRHPEDGIAWFGLGRAQENENKDDEAIISFRKAILLDSSNFEAHFRLGMIYGNKTLYSLAIGQFDSAIALHPDAPYIYYNRGIAKAKNHQPFCDDFKKCADMNYILGKDMYDKFCDGK